MTNGHRQGRGCALLDSASSIGEVDSTTKLRTAAALVALIVALTLSVPTGVGMARQGVTVFAGTVTVDGAVALAGTTVSMILQGGTEDPYPAQSRVLRVRQSG